MASPAEPLTLDVLLEIGAKTQAVANLALRYAITDFYESHANMADVIRLWSREKSKSGERTFEGKQMKAIRSLLRGMDNLDAAIDRHASPMRELFAKMGMPPSQLTDEEFLTKVINNTLNRIVAFFDTYGHSSFQDLLQYLKEHQNFDAHFLNVVPDIYRQIGVPMPAGSPHGRKRTIEPEVT